MEVCVLLHVFVKYIVFDNLIEHKNIYIGNITYSRLPLVAWRTSVCGASSQLPIVAVVFAICSIFSFVCIFCGCNIFHLDMIC